MQTESIEVLEVLGGVQERDVDQVSLKRSMAFWERRRVDCGVAGGVVETEPLQEVLGTK